MSGYFARLARKSTGEGLSRANGASHAVTPLEHSVNVETAPAAATAFADNSPYPVAAATPPATHAPAASETPAQALNSTQSAPSKLFSPSPAAPSGEREVPNLHSETPPQEPIVPPVTAPELQPAAPMLTGVKDVAGIAAPQQLLGDAVPPPAADEPRISQTQTERPQPRASVTSAETAARDQPRNRMARTAATSPTIDVRIGNLRIEVLPPPPPNIVFETPHSQPAPAAKPEAPSNFRPSRHYLRYGD